MEAIHLKRILLLVVSVLFFFFLPLRFSKKIAQALPEIGKANSDFLDGEGLAFVEGGCFPMGDVFGRGRADEQPVHEVCVNDFYMGKHEVTLGKFEVFIQETAYVTDAERDGGCLFWMGKGWRKDATVIWNRPGFSQTSRSPVTCVSWNDANAYLSWKRKKTGLPYRLPTEAEWEYAARSGGKSEALAGTKNTEQIDSYAWFRKNSGGRPQAVGWKKPNGLGLYDMSGNVWEWVSDRYHADYYQNSPRKNPKGPSVGKGHVMRGGSWYVIPKAVRTVHRNWTYAHKRYNSLGFRLAL